MNLPTLLAKCARRMRHPATRSSARSCCEQLSPTLPRVVFRTQEMQRDVRLIADNPTVMRFRRHVE
jgi:hypothetical protein